MLEMIHKECGGDVRVVVLRNTMLAKCVKCNKLLIINAEKK